MINTLKKIEKIFDKPGNEWSEDDHNDVINWLFQDQQLEFLHDFAIKKLSDDAQPSDAENAWHDFIIKTEIFNSIIKSYNPARGSRFWNYLLI